MYKKTLTVFSENIYMRTWLTLLSFLGASLAFAGPPYRTDDPEPTPYQHYEIFFASQFTRTADGESGTLPHIEINYGATPRIQIGIRLPYAFNQAQGETRQYGLGDIELGLKYRLLDESDARPMVSFFPSMKTHTGNEETGLGDGANSFLLPIWLGKSWGGWSTYGGAGYKINREFGAQNSWSMGWLLQRKISAPLSIGLEVFRETAQAAGESTSSGFNIGGIYDLDQYQHLMFSAGKGVEATQQTNQLSTFIAYLLTF